MGGGAGNPFTGAEDFGFGDIFSTIFGGGFGGGASSTRNGPMAGDDLRYNLTLTFEEAAFGCEKEIVISREEVCETCGGSGAKPGTRPTRCTTCGGTGQVRQQSQSILGSFVTTRPCSACRGTGQIITDPCPECKGRGRVKRNKRLTVRIPAGINDGQTLSKRNEGEAGYKGGPRGNLYITITVRPHEKFVRRGADLLLNMNIPYTVAVLGGEIVVPTLEGQIKYTVPAGTQNGTTFRLRDQGVQYLQQNGKGDLLVTVNVEIPKRVSEKERQLLEQLAQLQGAATVQKRRKGIFK